MKLSTNLFEQVVELTLPDVVRQVANVNSAFVWCIAGRHDYWVGVGECY